MVTVTGKLVGGMPARTEVTCTLVDVTGQRAVGYVADDQAEIVRPVIVRPQTDGTWSAELTPNPSIDAAAGDTVWAVQEGRALDGTAVVTHILVPEAGGPHWMGDLRVDLGDAPTGGGTIVYVPGPAGPAGTPGAGGQDGNPGEDGEDGATAYEVAVRAGFEGTEAQWLASLVGPQGERGERGLPGTNGSRGADGAPGVDGQQGIQGERGLPGADGADGVDGAQGEQGERGEEGPKGDKGDQGDPGEQGSKGDPGDPGEEGPAGLQGDPGPQPSLGAAGAGSDIALRSTDPTTTNARTPTAHAASHTAGGTDAITPAAIGAAPVAVPGVYVPAGWGQFWRAARTRATAGTGLARIVTVGGSATQGMYASNPITKSWPGVVRTALQAEYGDGGSGFMTSSLSSTILASGDAAALAAWTTAGAIIGQAGSWSQGGSKYGPGVNYIYSETTGDTLTFKARGTTVRIYTVVGGSTRPTMSYKIDMASAVSVAQPSGTAAIQVTTVTGLADAEHTVVLTVGAATSGQYLSVCGVSGENASGVIVHNLALAGAKAETYALNATTALNSTWNGGVDFPCDLAIYTAGPNDAAANTTGDAWAANVAKWIKGVRDTGAAVGDTDIIIAMPHLGTHDVTNFKYQDYAERGRSLADVYGCAFVNWWALGRNSWQYWNSLGYWGTSAGTGVAGTDSVHMSDAGFASMAAPVVTLLKT